MESKKSNSKAHRTWLATCLGIGLTAEFLALTCVSVHSDRFAYDSSVRDRPILLVLILLTLASLLQWGCIAAALRLPDKRALKSTLFSAAVAFRAVLWWSEPIQEVDAYRYVWDGATVAQGINPYGYSPQSIFRTGKRTPDQDELTRLIAKDDSLRLIHSRVHFAHLTTVYPPVSQLVFAVAYLVTPADASPNVYLRTFKTFILLFDVATLALVMHLLALTGQHSGWSLVIGGSPLVLKEFANSGHLDSIAVCLMIAALVVLVRWNDAENPKPADEPRPNRGRWASGWNIGISAVLLALGVGAKLFPIVVAPAIAAWLQRRCGWKTAVSWLTVFVFVAACACAPMLLTINAPDHSSASGIRTFFQNWEINDLIFMVIEENARPEFHVKTQPPLWFAVTPDAWRVCICNFATHVTGISMDRAPFAIARALTLAIFVSITLWVTCSFIFSESHPSTCRMLGACFSLLAWFWMLAPTQNPWYWTWAMPLVVFASHRTWFLVAPLALAYYLRFWCEYQLPSIQLRSITYTGTDAFDFVIVWLEFAPLLILLAAESFFGGRSRAASIEKP